MKVTIKVPKFTVHSGQLSMAWYWAKALLRPSYWLMVSPYNKKWDRHFRKLIETGDFKRDGQFTMTMLIGGERIWISNYPYAVFHLWEPGVANNVRPSRATIAWAASKLRAAGYMVSK